VVSLNGVTMARLSVTLDAADMIASFEEKARTNVVYKTIFVKDNTRHAVVASLQETFNHMCDCQRTVLMNTNSLCITWSGGDETSLDYLWLRRPFFGSGTNETFANVLSARKSQAMADERWLHHQLGRPVSCTSMKVMKGQREGFWNAWYFSVHVGLCGTKEQKGYLCDACGPLLSMEDCKCGDKKGPQSLVVLWPKEQQIAVGLVQYDKFLSSAENLSAGLPNDEEGGVKMTMRHVLTWARVAVECYKNASKPTPDLGPTKKKTRRL
jgi:hypothetical protein